MINLKKHDIFFDSVYMQRHMVVEVPIDASGRLSETVCHMRLLANDEFTNYIRSTSNLVNRSRWNFVSRKMK